MERFRANDIMTLVGSTPRHELGESYGPHLRLSELLDAHAVPPEMPIGYGTPAGDPRLRQAIAEAHGVSPEDVVVTVGGMHALFLLAFILCQRGDEAVITTPAFPPARGALEAVGATLRLLPLSFDRGYRLDVAALGGLLSRNTRLVSLASPQNPSGVAIAADTLGHVVALMRATCPDAYLVMDEEYREAAYGTDRIAASAVHLDAKVVSVASLSKCHGAPGLRVGWAITRDAALRRQLVLGKFNTVISCSPIDEALASEVLARRERILAERAVLLAQALRRTEAWVRENGDFVEWVRPNAGALCCIRLRPAVFDEAAVSRFCRATAGTGVRVANGAWFGDEPRVFRLGFGFTPAAELEAALQALALAIRQSVRRAT